MKASLIIILLFMTSIADIGGQSKNDYTDGPYIAVKGTDSLEVLWVKKGKLKVETSLFEKPFLFNKDGLPIVKIQKLTTPSHSKIRYDNVSKFVALSDIHGQHDIFLELMHKHNIIDTNCDWNYGDGHLVIVGDIMDRGPKVMETLWMLYDLEQQAIQAGGRVHVLLGNHELMVMEGNLNYLSPKYRYTSGISGRPYQSFFDQSTILGRWLQSKPITVVLNGVGFVHGGFSLDILKKEKSLQKINQVFRDSIVLKRPLSDFDNKLSALLYFENGPLWYRGYANPKGFDKKNAKKILKLLDLDHIVVGHTSMPEIKAVADGKIFLIDSSIKFGKGGELLIYQNDKFYRGLIDGQKKIIIPAS